jgi:hypothetical protein
MLWSRNLSTLNEQNYLQEWEESQINFNITPQFVVSLPVSCYASQFKVQFPSIQHQTRFDAPSLESDGPPVGNLITI